MGMKLKFATNLKEKTMTTRGERLNKGVDPKVKPIDIPWANVPCDI